MTLPNSGPMSIGSGGNITTEFGLSADAPFPSAYYGKGGAPPSGPLSFADFYGRSNALNVDFAQSGISTPSANTYQRTLTPSSSNGAGPFSASWVISNRTGPLTMNSSQSGNNLIVSITSTAQGAFAAADITVTMTDANGARGSATHSIVITVPSAG